jgi:predicted PurR-regulated permease PerM
MLGLDPKAARATWTVIAVLLLCLTIYSIRHTLFMFIVAILFAYLLLPIVDLLDRFLPIKRSRGPALAIVYTLLIAAIVVAGIEIGSSVAAQANNLAERISEYLKPDQSHFLPLPLPQPLMPMGQRFLGAIRVAVQSHYQELLQTLPQTVLRAAGAAANLVVIVIIPILSFFFLKDGRTLYKSVVAQFEDRWDRVFLREIASDLNVLLAQYMRALVLLGLTASVTYGAFFAIMGVPYTALLAALVFPLEFIPMLGPLLSSAIILLVVGFSGGHHIVGILVFLALYRIFQDYVLSPHLMSAGTALHPLLVIFGVFAGEQIGGVGGAFLSVPAMAFLRLLYQRLERSVLRKEIASTEIPTPEIVTASQ